MKNKLLFIFPVALILTYFVISQGIKQLNDYEDELDADETFIIQETVSNRFALFLKLPLSLGYIGADYFGYNDKLAMETAPFAKNLLTLNKDILGLNLLDAHGKIISVFPFSDNASASGKITQNYEQLKQSLKREDTFWLSPPFKLFQGGQGFVFYVPISDAKGNHKGWFAPVMSTKLFATEFKLVSFLKTFDLIIRDEETGTPYFATGIDPDPSQKIYKSKNVLYGRKLEFLSWRKVPNSHINLPWYLLFLISFVPAFIITFMVKLFLQRKIARVQLQDISILLRLTSREALAKLIDLQTEFYRIGSTENMAFVTNLIEQIELLQTIAYDSEEVETTTQDFLPLLQDELSTLDELIQKKSLSVTYSPEAFKDIHVDVNSWLLKNCVLSNILIHAIINADAGTGLNIDCKKTDRQVQITYHTQRTIRSETVSNGNNHDRRMEVARHALSISKGDLLVQQDLGGGIIIRMTLPI